MRKKYIPYQTVVVNKKTYDDYNVKIKGIIYEISVCRQISELTITKDEWQGK